MLPKQLENFITSGGLGNYFQQLANPFRGSSIQQRPVVNPEYLRPDFSGAGERARRFQEYRTGRDIPGANTDYSARSGQSTPAAERAYQTEKARVAQMAAQNPDLQRYEAARKIAAAQGATPEQVQSAEDLGMQMWAKANPTLAAKVKPGQSGYEAIQGIVGPSAASALSNQQVLGVMSFDPNTVLTTTQNIQGQFRPNQQLTDQEILAAMSFDPNVAMRSAANIAYAPMSAAESAMLQEVGGPQGEYITPMDSFVPPAQKRREANQAASPDAFARILEGIRLYGGG